MAVAVGVIERLKARPGEDIIKYGNSRLDRTLLKAHLVDDLRRLEITPAMVGTGERRFEEVDTSSAELALNDIRNLANSSVILTYVPS